MSQDLNNEKNSNGKENEVIEEEGDEEEAYVEVIDITEENTMSEDDSKNQTQHRLTGGCEGDAQIDNQYFSNPVEDYQSKKAMNNEEDEEMNDQPQQQNNKRNKKKNIVGMEGKLIEQQKKKKKKEKQKKQSSLNDHIENQQKQERIGETYKGMGVLKSNGKSKDSPFKELQTHSNKQIKNNKFGIKDGAKVAPQQFLGVEEELDDSDEDDEEIGGKNGKKIQENQKQGQNGQQQEEEQAINEEQLINYKQTIMGGSFLPVMVLLQKKKVNVEDIIDNNQGLRILHYACYFGKIKALKALVEIYKADTNVIDYRGQAPIHVASTSGELSSIVYLCSRGEQCERDSKDNALMTPLMNSVSNNHPEQFIYLYFKENCEIKTLDLQGNTLLHLASKSNSVTIAKLLKHLYEEYLLGGEDPNLSLERSPEKNSNSFTESQKNYGSATSNQNSSKADKLCFFDVNRKNSLGQSPIFLTIQARSIEMMKFFLKLKNTETFTNIQCDITMKDQRGDTIKDNISRFLGKDQEFLNSYYKYEARILIEKVLENQNELKIKIDHLAHIFRFDWIFINEFLKYLIVDKIYKLHSLLFVLSFYIITYICHWIFVMHSSSPTNEEVTNQQDSIEPMIFHLSLIMLAISLFFFEKSEPGFIPKKNILKDKDTNIIGKVLDLIDSRQFHRIEETRNKYCFDCLLVRPKHSLHCEHCNSCVLYKQKHSKVFNRCVGQDNARPYLCFLFFNFIFLIMHLKLSTQCFQQEMRSTRQFLQNIEMFILLYRYSKILFLFQLFIIIVLIRLTDDLITMVYAISRKMTQYELSNIWFYKYCFVVTSNEGKNEFIHKKYNLFQQIKFFFLFLRGKLLNNKHVNNGLSESTLQGPMSNRKSNGYQEFESQPSYRSNAIQQA